MKPFIFFIFSIFFLSLVSCSDSNPGPSPAPETLPLESHFSEISLDDLDKLIVNKYIRVLTTFNKTGYYISNGKAFGHEYSLLKDYQKHLNSTQGKNSLKIVIEFIPCARDELIPKLIEGKGDIIAAGLTATSTREALADFTSPYLKGIDEIVIVHNQIKPAIKTLDDLSGQRVFVRKSSSYYESLLLLNKKLKKAQKEKIKIISADEQLETEDILELVNSGVEKITICDSHIAKAWMSSLKNLSALPDLIIREDSNIAWMVRKNNPLLKKSLNGFIKKYKQGTLHGNMYFNRYFTQTQKTAPAHLWGHTPINQQYISLISKYSKKYKFDENLIMAMAFQESGFDNTKTNPSGAIGIMQVRPATARDKKIGIHDITSPENNIHAGVKYLAFLRDHYFDDPKINERDRIRFAVASYNAGPAKINRTRNRAAKMTLDPNVWFRNVELAALKIIGQETVKYVSNVNKYSIAYTLTEQNLKSRNQIKSELKNK